MVFALLNDRFYPSHWTFHFFSIIFTVKSFEVLHFKADSSKLLLQFYLPLQFSFIKWHKQLFFFIMAFPQAREGFLTIWFQYLIAITFLSTFFFLQSGIFRPAFLTLKVTCSFTFIAFSFWFSLFIFHVPFTYDVLFPRFKIKITFSLYLFNQ